jgi:hypothetical protein
LTKFRRLGGDGVPAWGLFLPKSGGFWVEGPAARVSHFGHSDSLESEPPPSGVRWHWPPETRGEKLANDNEEKILIVVMGVLIWLVFSCSHTLFCYGLGMILRRERYYYY